MFFYLNMSLIKIDPSKKNKLLEEEIVKFYNENEFFRDFKIGFTQVEYSKNCVFFHYNYDGRNGIFEVVSNSFFTELGFKFGSKVLKTKESIFANFINNRGYSKSTIFNDKIYFAVTKYFDIKNYTNGQIFIVKKGCEKKYFITIEIMNAYEPLPKWNFRIIECDGETVEHSHMDRLSFNEFILGRIYA